MQANWLWGFDQFIGELTKGGSMSNWGNSTVETRYVWERLRYIMENEFGDDLEQAIWDFMDELVHNYKVDTGEDL